MCEKTFKKVVEGFQREGTFIFPYFRLSLDVHLITVYLLAQMVKCLPKMQESQFQSLGLAHCRWILYHLSHQGSPMVCYISLILENP